MTETRVDAMFSKLLLNTCLIFMIVIATTAIDTSVDTRNCPRNYSLPFYVYPIHYNIELALRDNTFDGESSIIIEILQQVTEISLHAEMLQIDFNTILLSKHRRKKQEGQKGGRKPWAFTYCTETQILVLKFKENIDAGTYELSMKFSGSLLGPKGLVAISRTINKGEVRQSYVTLFEPTGARRAFPCWDSWIWTSTYNISIVHSDDLRAWANMPVLKKSLVAYKRVQTHFVTSPYMSVCYLAIAVTNVEIVYTYYKYPSNITIWCAPNTRSRLGITEAVVPMIDHFIAKNMSFTWRGSVINFIVFPNLPTNFIGNWGAAIVRQEYIVDKGISVGHQIEVQRRIAHAIVRHYLETFNTFVMWFTEWFRRGLALYLSYDIIAESQLHARMGDLFVVQVVQPALRNDIVLNVPHITSEYDPIYSPFINNKASIIIRMIKHMITKEVFNQGIASYLKLNYLNFPDDLWKFLKYGVFKDPDHLEELKFSWLSQPNYPILYLIGHKDGRGKYIKQNHPTKIVDQIRIWMIPVTYTTQTELNFWDTSPKLWYMEGAQDLHKLDPNDWIIFNIQQTGFYRVSYDNDNWSKLARYLNEKDHTKIHHLNRAQLIDDAYHFMMKLEMNYNIFYYLINYLWKEQEYIPWHSMTNILHYTSPFLNFPESQHFKNHIMNILIKHLISQESNKKKVVATKLLILYWSCKYGDRRSRESMKNNLIYHLTHLKENTIRAGWEDWTYCAGLMTADTTIWNAVATDFIARNHTAKLKHLTCTDNNIVVNEFFNSITSKINHKWASLESEHLVALYRGIMKKHARRKEVFRFFLANFEKILPNLLSTKEKFGSLIMNVYTTCDIFKIWTFVNWNYSGNLSIKHEVEFMLTWRKKELQRQKDMFLGPFNITQYDDTC